ncbi:MAG TPA: hypothetical protein VFF65_05115 [Phycisphaerales bacterium]|nr:hypothetical protein [Phycisphaerales bacterium]
MNYFDALPTKFLLGRRLRWLSLRIWLPTVLFGTMIVDATLVSMRRGSSSVGGLGYRTYYDGTRIVHGQDAEVHRAIWIEVKLGHERTPLRWAATAALDVRDALSHAPLTDAHLVEVARRSALARFDLQFPQGSRWKDNEDVSIEYVEWVRAAWRTAISDEGAPSTSAVVPSKFMLASWYGLHAAKWFIWIATGLAAAYWLARWLGISHARQMVRRHERGLCPDCLYELPSRNAGVCSECGSDPVARYFAAMHVINESNRTRFQWVSGGNRDSTG